jgi:acetyl esterase/lipase
VGTEVWRRLKSSRTRSRSKNAKPRESKTSPPLPGRDSPDVDAGTDSQGGVKGTGAIPERVEDQLHAKDKERVIYYVHGGAYYVGNAATHRLITIGVSKACNARVFGEKIDSTAFLMGTNTSLSSYYIPPRP